MTESGLSLTDGMDLAGLTYPELWTRYFAIGGNGTEADLRRHITADTCDDDHEHNLIAHAINEAFLDRGSDHPVAYRHLYKPDH